MQYPSGNLFVQKSKLLDQVREKIRFKHYSIRTEQTYTDWIRRLCILASGICVKWGWLRPGNFDAFGGGGQGVDLNPEPSAFGVVVFVQSRFDYQITFAG
ncbi:phage integrase N-terminal SAM-like domain-containing protein [Methylovulum psychrotolerans]|uniref:Integrase SAM-like N-terminal domain-containing protein n=1 Tax=Methylovulum psychrotolerans TaxID=1704499 RepID=A0A2S5CN48_9GAMM|nr:phage integrase N-terminal SAM-like domain-containing protein [Methylovulum psychrotolerans]POZ52177.1 hypothetical protein AADEFJLK_01648 [Methylovulum psychrotolerans]